MNKLKEEFDKLSGDQYNVSWNDKVEIIYLKDYIDFLEKKIEALSQHYVIKNEVAVCEPHGCLDYSQGYARCEKQCDRCKEL